MCLTYAKALDKTTHRLLLGLLLPPPIAVEFPESGNDHFLATTDPDYDGFPDARISGSCCRGIRSVCFQWSKKTFCFLVVAVILSLRRN